MNSVVAAALIALMAHGAFAQSANRENPLAESETWLDLRDDFVDEGTTLLDGSALFEVMAPFRAHDAATVPLVLTHIDQSASPISSAMVIIDENPAPMAAHMKFGELMHPLKFELRVRVDQYSNIRVLAQSGDSLFMNGRFVKASGGCSAPATKDMQAALDSMGVMRLKHFDDAPQMSGQRREAQIMIRHPNYSGLQRDQITHLFINAHFIETLEVYQGDDVLFTVEGGISISENPVFRFDYTDNGAPNLRIVAKDTDGNVFDQVLAKDVQS